METSIKILVRTPDFRVTRMGHKLGVHFHRRYAALFAPIVWDFCDESDIDLVVREARCLCAGQYSRLALSSSHDQVGSVPADSLGINFARCV